MKLGSTISVLRMFDEEKAAEFYLQFLGFSKDWEHRFGDGFPLYMQISKDDCVIHLTGHHGDSCPGSTVRIHTQDVESYSKSLRDKDYVNAKPGCQKTEWGTVEMTIHDPFGNRLIFAERLES
ncbi:hypothetical protein EI77_04391 [Prosthecobacter fusiformis]|uniref:Bleomycin resistance protein n=1 Tax=Prosthecobacter fusiformis TaxID=48464 RepID=A0A4R7RKL8_9BACT|nr:glyoxalase superfamily protein [Prosthecobacter fusiformis]TDU63183.1 hypothetical protein EI77_04391 [Prosthecobacter fusiformis]